MSSLSSVFNSCSTIITLDIYKKLQPETSEKKLVLVGQIATVMMVAFGVVWIPFMKSISGQLYQYLQSVQAYISPPIAAVFLIGLFWKRVNSKGAIASLVTGFVLGMGRLIAEINKEDLSGILYDYADINFLHFAILLFLICTGVLITVSFASAPPETEVTDGLTYKKAFQSQGSKPSWRATDKKLSYLLVTGVALIWLYFTG